jgi:hypothetical protein
VNFPIGFEKKKQEILAILALQNDVTLLHHTTFPHMPPFIGQQEHSQSPSQTDGYATISFMLSVFQPFAVFTRHLVVFRLGFLNRVSPWKMLFSIIYNTQKNYT